MSNTCGTCRFRGMEITHENEEFETEPKGYFLCTRIRHAKNWEFKKGQGALVEDASGCYAALCVEGDFGCKLWEGK